MIRNIRDVAIILWVVCQGLAWFYPGVAGVYDARKEAAYYAEMDKLGIWSE